MKNELKMTVGVELGISEETACACLTILEMYINNNNLMIVHEVREKGGVSLKFDDIKHPQDMENEDIFLNGINHKITLFKDKVVKRDE